jgi:quercetin dioxygenase-like cupin family protein
MESMNRRDVLAGLAALAAMGAATADAQATNGLDTSKVFRFSEMQQKPSANGGWSRAVVKGSLATGEFVEVHETMLPAGQMPHPPHKHPNSEFILLREGEVQYWPDGKPDPNIVHPGDVIFTASNQLHGMKNVSNKQALYYVVSVSKQLS